MLFLKERYKNLAAIKSNKWSEPKMLLKIILTYFKNNIDEIYILFQMLPALSFRFPIDINVSFILLLSYYYFIHIYFYFGTNSF